MKWPWNRFPHFPFLRKNFRGAAVRLAILYYVYSRAEVAKNQNLLLLWVEKVGKYISASIYFVLSFPAKYFWNSENTFLCFISKFLSNYENSIQMNNLRPQKCMFYLKLTFCVFKEIIGMKHNSYRSTLNPAWCLVLNSDKTRRGEVWA